MGNYYSGVMNSSYDSELKHHGILGQKWGVRRFQNDDGTWTAAGKERYGRNSAGKFYSKQVKSNDRVAKLFKSKAAATAKRKAEKRLNAYNNLDDDRKATVDSIVREMKRSGLKNAAKDAAISALIGIGGGIGYSSSQAAKRDEETKRYEKQIDDILFNNAKLSGYSGKKNDAKSISKLSPRDGGVKKGESTDPRTHGSAEMMKRFEKYLNVQGTNSLFGGNHKDDESTKVLEDFNREYSKQEKKYNKDNKELKKNNRDDYEWGRNELEWQLQDEYRTKYAKAILKDMGYDVNPGSVNWLVEQPWFDVKYLNAKEEYFV